MLKHKIPKSKLIKIIQLVMKNKLSNLICVLMFLATQSGCKKNTTSTSTACATNAIMIKDSCTYSRVVFYVMSDTLNHLPVLPLNILIDNSPLSIGSIDSLALNQPNNCSTELPKTVYAQYQIIDSLQHSWTAIGIGPDSGNTISGTFQASATQNCIMIKVN